MPEDKDQATPNDADTPDVADAETRRKFIGRAGAPAAVPVVVALSMAWTNAAHAY